MAIAKKIENTPILPNFNTDSFLTSKLILEGSYAFAFFLQWIYILADERNLQKHFGRNYSNFENRNSEADLKGLSKDSEEYLDDEEFEGNCDEQIFDFVEIPSLVTLFTGLNVEPLYFLKITEKGISDVTLNLKPVCSRNIFFKKFDILPMSVIIIPDEVYDTYV